MGRKGGSSRGARRETEEQKHARLEALKQRWPSRNSSMKVVVKKDGEVKQLRTGLTQPVAARATRKHKPLTISWSEGQRHNPIKLSLPNGEERHFNFGSSEQGILLLRRLRRAIPNFTKSEFGKPRDIARLLNSLGVTTACGVQWTPRLVGFLVAYLDKNPATASEQQTKIAASGRMNPANGLAAQISRMKTRDTVTLWRNAVRILSEDGKRRQHPQARKAINAINAEWTRRRQEHVNGDEEFPWPTTDASPGRGGLKTSDWLEEGVLKFVGYTVGSTNGEPQRVRERILTELFHGTIPPVFPDEYLDDWGDPSSTFRLREMAETIAALTRNAKRQRGSRMVAAIRD